MIEAANGAFLPDDAKGGTNDFAGRIYVDSGVLNPQLRSSLRRR